MLAALDDLVADDAAETALASASAALVVAVVAEPLAAEALEAASPAFVVAVVADALASLAFVVRNS